MITFPVVAEIWLAAIVFVGDVRVLFFRVCNPFSVTIPPPVPTGIQDAPVADVVCNIYPLPSGGV